MVNPKILCLMPCLPDDFNEATVRSVLNQTVPVTMIISLPERVNGSTVAAKLSKVLNNGLNVVDLNFFDYILRVDSDVVLPSDFIEKNLQGEPDGVGDAGYAMLLKVQSFVKVLNARFHPLSDDSYTRYKMLMAGCKWRDYTVEPELLRQAGKSYNAKYFLQRGELMYALGYEPIHVLFSFLWEWRNILAVFGYFKALFNRMGKLDVASFVWRSQIHKLLMREEVAGQ